MIKKPVVLIILDGWGIGENDQGNALRQARLPNFDILEREYPFLALNASGIAVGLPWQEEGNSEVGHIAIGSGRVVYQYLPRIIFSIRDGSFFKNPAFLKAARHAKKNNSTLHLMGLFSSGSVHSYIDHIYALLDFAQNESISKIRLHLFTDGRNAPPKESARSIANFNERIKALNQGRIATIMGRFYAMDRDGNWDRIQAAYRCLVEGDGARYSDPVYAIEESYRGGATDEFIKPIMLESEDDDFSGRIRDNDAVIFFNWRADSARQITKAFVSREFDKFPRKKLNNLLFATMGLYEKNLPVEVAFSPQDITNSLAEALSDDGKRQFRIAESEKYAHITYFFNGGREKIFPGEDRVLIPSWEMTSPDNSPEMKAPEITSRLIAEIDSASCDFALANIANGDMIGHTGNFQAAVKAAEIIDEQVGKIMQATLRQNGALLITSDHGNIEEMVNIITGEVKTGHTRNSVPFYLATKELRRPKSDREIALIKREARGLLSDVAPTILELMGIAKPKEMTGHSLMSFF